MKTIIVLTVSLFLMSPLQQEDPILGTWSLDENKTDIEITKDGENYKGIVIKSDAEKAIGKVILQDLKKEGEVWVGKFYAVRKDRLVDATLTALGDDDLELKVMAGRRSRTLDLSRLE